MGCAGTLSAPRTQVLGPSVVSIISTCLSAERGVSNPGFETDHSSTKDKVLGFMHKHVLAKSSKTKELGPPQAAEKDQEAAGGKRKTAKKGTFIDRIIDDKCGENSCFSLQCLKVFKVRQVVEERSMYQ